MSESFPNSLRSRILHIRQTLPASVRLIAVTKQVPVSVMREAYAAGIRDFGENRVQEAEVKQAQLQDLPGITWHFIGHLQSNKAQKALEQFQWIHSLDSLELAKRMNRLAGNLSITPQVLLQTKILSDPNKYGWTISDLFKDLSELNQLTQLKISGLMTILPVNLSRSEIATVFQDTSNLAKKIQEQNFSNIQMQELSMGMSDDYPFAVQAGATMIRLGRILFGERAT